MKILELNLTFFLNFKAEFVFNYKEENLDNKQ